MSLHNLSSNKLRQKFLDFFEKKGHKILHPFSLVPENDPTVLFTTAGMQQFKRFYLFPKEAPAARITTCQKCLRTGDIDEVGDESHLTFFEMLGNFSFGYPSKKGSYFKKEAIEMAWEFLTSELKIEKKRISATYFAGDRGISADDESKELLFKVTGLEKAKILGTGFDETFWSLGTEGSPGGPTVEFYIDGVEVWNLVFNEYLMRGGKYVKSGQKGVDTGMGLERLTAIIQNKNDVYQTDIFALIISKIESVSGKKYAENKREFRIIADHLRAASALISDGVLPSNKDRGYILRRLIRRMVVKGRQIGIDKNFTGELVDSGEVKEKLDVEEGKFGKTLEKAIMQFEVISGMRIGDREKEGPYELSADELFDLYQTYGLPLEIALEMAKEKNVPIKDGAIGLFERMRKIHQEESRTASAGMFKGGLADNKVETTRLHTAAHLLLAALRQVLGPQVQQKGSNITGERLRFDFNNPEKLTPEQISKIENLVNEKIKENLPVEMAEMSLEEAKKSGATGVFDDRYGEKVKVYSIGLFSREICGGPHVKNTGELGHFKVTKEESSSAGVRRIKAVLE
jgi:alanyl-tRNA synthetase